MFNLNRIAAIAISLLGSVAVVGVVVSILDAWLAPAMDLTTATAAFAGLIAYYAALAYAFWHFYHRGRFSVLVIFLTLVGSTTVAVVLLSLAMLGLSQVGKGLGLPLLIVIVMFYAWALYAFFHYRQSRQDEFLQFVAAAVEALAPLPQALDAYLRDRPRGPLREAFVIALMLTLPGYYWIWHQWHNFDRRLGRVADLLDQGYSLTEALTAVPGVASRETIMLAALGQSTARLDICLRHSLQQRYATVWLEVLPRLAYPLAVLFFFAGITSFWMVFLYPKLVRIFQEFDRPLPWQTALLGDVCAALKDLPWLLPACMLLVLGVVSVLIGSPTARWHCPGVGRLYRGHVQAQVLRLLGLLLAAGKTVPEALQILADSDYFAPVAQRRLRGVCERVERGEPLAACLIAGKLVTPAVAPLVQGAEHLRNLPWALTELGDHAATQTIGRIRRLSLLASPASVFGIGLIIGFSVIAMFIPLLQLMESLTE
jgi:type IV pilus assembly protein PilC